ncbi:hypothetical protein GCM10023116_50340 [Kistimonas scapharcae]|uniref:Tetratricopeptide repeat protein n=1 Tax=Kistimonas scapharcae TaxID=1036133 RepID=A0ABP8VBY6_9GAMM
MAEGLGREAIGFIDRVLAEERDADMLQLKGRILRWQGRLEDAAACFAQAVEAGMPIDVMVEDRMELAFLQRDFIRLTDLAHGISGLAYQPPRLARALRHWRKKGDRLSAGMPAAE